MNYKYHYDLLINRARNRILNGYFENHHVIPKCLGGIDDGANLVKLTAEEHYTAHLLLAKIHNKDAKLIFAANMMTVSNGIHKRSNNKSYGWVRRKAAIASSKREITDEHRNKLKEKRKGRKPALGSIRSDEAKKQQSKSLKIAYENISKDKRREKSDKIWETRRKNGFIISDETKKKISESLKKRNAKLRQDGIN